MNIFSMQVFKNTRLAEATQDDVKQLSDYFPDGGSYWIIEVDGGQEEHLTFREAMTGILLNPNGETIAEFCNATKICISCLLPGKYILQARNYIAGKWFSIG